MIALFNPWYLHYDLTKYLFNAVNYWSKHVKNHGIRQESSIYYALFLLMQSKNSL